MPPQARELAELLDFAEQERLTLLDKEAVLQQELEQVSSGLRAPAEAAATTQSQRHRRQVPNHCLTPTVCVHALNLGLTVSACVCPCCVFPLQLRGCAVAAEKGASDARVETAAVAGQLAAVREEVRTCTGGC